MPTTSENAFHLWLAQGQIVIAIYRDEHPDVADVLDHLADALLAVDKSARNHEAAPQG